MVDIHKWDEPKIKTKFVTYICRKNDDDDTWQMFWPQSQNWGYPVKVPPFNIGEELIPIDEKEAFIHVI